MKQIEKELMELKEELGIPGKLLVQKGRGKTTLGMILNGTLQTQGPATKEKEFIELSKKRLRNIACTK